MSKSIPLDKIVHLYQRKQMSAKEIAEKYGVTRQAIHYRLKQAGIPARGLRLYAKYPEKELLERLYHGERLSMPQVAERLGESLDRIIRAMNFHDIRRRSRGGQPKFPQLRDLKVGESIELPIQTNNRYVTCYDMARKAGIRVGVRTIDNETVRVTRTA